MPKKLLIIGDPDSANSGLARIKGDIAKRIYTNLGHVFTVATAGCGETQDKPWKQYDLKQIDNWMTPELPSIARKFADGEELIIFFIWDASRLGWFANPESCPDEVLRTWLSTAKIKKWGYLAVDAEGPGPDGKHSYKLAEIYAGFDRVLNYSKFSANVTGYPDYLPHGIDTSVFKPRDKRLARKGLKGAGFEVKDGSFLVGICGTNQNRKDWSLAIQTARILLDRGLDVRLWINTDVMVRYWDIGALIIDYELHNRVLVTANANLSDEQLSWFYSACDVFLSIGLGEGYGYGQYEALACGVPVVAGDYCGSEWLPSRMTVKPKAYRYEGVYCCKRPVFDPREWANAAINVTLPSHIPIELPAELDWNVLWPHWEKWLLKGV